jgi:hypothetical protein
MGVVSQKLVRGRAIVDIATSVDPGAYVWAAGVAINLVAMWGGALSFDAAIAAPANDNERVVLALAPMSKPQSAESVAGATPPEMPMPLDVGVAPSPTQAVWRYLCDRDAGIGEAVRRTCPEAISDGNAFTAFKPLRLDGNSYEPAPERYVPTEGPARTGLGPFPWDARFGAANDN